MSFLARDIKQASAVSVDTYNGKYYIAVWSDFGTGILNEHDQEWGKTPEEDKRIRNEMNEKARQIFHSKNHGIFIPLGLCKDTGVEYDFPVPYVNWVWEMAHHKDEWKYWDTIKDCAGPEGVLSWAALEKRCQAVCEGFRLEWEHFYRLPEIKCDKKWHDYRIQFQEWRNANS